MTSEFEREVRPRGSGAANMRAGSLPFVVSGVSARSAGRPRPGAGGFPQTLSIGASVIDS